MRRIALAVALLWVARAGSAEPEPAKDEARPLAQSSSPEEQAPAADPPAPGPQQKWALPDLPPPIETELRIGTTRRTRPLGASPAPKTGPGKKPGAASPEAKAAKDVTPSPGPKAPLLAGMRAVSLVEGEARVTVADGERVLRPGDRLGADTVRSVADGLIVFDRPAVAGEPGGPAIVVVRFEANGQARVRVLYEQDPTPVPAPRMK